MATTAPVSDDLVRRARSEFLEMPGLRLTPVQARRLWGLDEASCSTLLARLVDVGFLFRTRDGAYMRIDSGRPAAAHPARAASISAA